MLLILAGTALLSGLGLTALSEGPLHTTSFWLTLVVGVLAIIGAVGWGYTEIRNQERLSQRRETNGQRVISYVGMLVVVAAIAVCAATIPSRLAPVIWILYVPACLAGGWWLRRRSRTRRSRARTH